MPLVLFPSLPWYRRAIQLILIKSCIVSLQGSTFAFTCLEFVIFLKYYTKILVHPCTPLTAAWTLITGLGVP